MNWKLLWQSFRELKHYIIAAALIFATGLVLGFVYPENFNFIIRSQLKGMGQIAQNLAEKEHAQLWFFIFIFLNNVIKSAVIVFAGAFFALPPIFFLIMNGMILGYLGADKTPEQIFTLFVKGILPHGIIEIPAIILACAYGIRFGIIMIKGLFSGIGLYNRSRFASEFTGFIKVTLPLVLLLGISLLVAALIESTITFWLLAP